MDTIMWQDTRNSQICSRLENITKLSLKKRSKSKHCLFRKSNDLDKRELS